MKPIKLSSMGFTAGLLALTGGAAPFHASLPDVPLGQADGWPNLRQKPGRNQRQRRKDRRRAHAAGMRHAFR